MLAAIGNRSVVELTELTFTAAATDADLPANTLTFSLLSAPTGAAIDPTTGVFTWTPSEAQGPADYTFTVQACDATLCGSETITVAVSEDTYTHSISLAAGWNLVSFNLQPLDSDIADVLATISGNYTLVYVWDSTGASSGSGNWLKYDASAAPYANTLTSLDEANGFWIYMTSADTLEVTGTTPAVTTVALSTGAGGWNLVGYPSAANGSLPEILSEHGAGDFTVVYAYHVADTADPWKVYDRSAPAWSNDLGEIAPGWGYWVFVDADNTWSVTY